MERKDILKRISSIGKRSKTLTKDIQEIGLQCIAHRNEHGDCTLASHLVNVLSNGARKEALKAWFRAFGAMAWEKKSEQFKCTKDKCDLEGAADNPWNMFTKEKEVSEYDLNKAISQLKRLHTRVVKELDVEAQQRFNEACKHIEAIDAVAA